MEYDSTMQPLPTPDEESRKHSERCAAWLRQRIGDGSLSFAEFMHACLYTPGLGYYAAGSRKFGAGGDFVTAPEISPVFSFVLARQVADVLAQLDGGSVLEFGAGSGIMAVDILRRLETLDTLPERYLILEVAPDLQQRQQRYIARALPDHADRFEWIDEVPATFSGVMLANEVLDALPVERFGMSGGAVMQQRVAVDGERFAFAPAPAPAVLERAVRRVESVSPRLTGRRAWHGRWCPAPFS